MFRRIWRLVRQNRLLAAVPVVYLVIAWGHWGIRRTEFYPFAPWSMFNNVPRNVTRYVVVLHTSRDNTQTLPARVWDCIPGGIKSLPLPFYRAQQELGLAIASNDRTGQQPALKCIEQFLRTHFGNGTAALVRESFDPAQMLLTGVPDETKVLTEFSF